MSTGYPIKVRFKDIDIAGHVHNSVYLSYFEEARIAYFEEFVDSVWNWKQKGLILARNEVDYVSPVYLKDKIECLVSCILLGNKSFTLSFVLKDVNSDKVFAKGQCVMVCFDYIEMKSVPVFNSWKTQLSLNI